MARNLWVATGSGHVPLLLLVASVGCSAGGGSKSESPEEMGDQDFVGNGASLQPGFGDVAQTPPGAGGSTGDGSVTPPAGTGTPPQASEGGGASPSIGELDPGVVDPTSPESPPLPPTVSEGFIRGPDPTRDSAAKPGPFDVQSVRQGLRDGAGYGTQTLYYPSGAEPPFAGVVVVPGFLAAESSTAAWGPFLASYGIVTLTIGTNSPTDSPDARATALLDGIETIKAENVREGGPLEGQIAEDRFGIMGWSMGGGGTLIAADGNPALRAAIPLAAWSPGATFASDQVPTLLFAGSADPLAGGQSQGFYASIPESTPKMLYEVAGGAHDVANAPSGARGEVGLYGLSWMKVFLEGDERYRQFLLQPPTQQADFLENL